MKRNGGKKEEKKEGNLSQTPALPLANVCSRTIYSICKYSIMG